MKIGKWYIVIGKLCMGFGKPPQEYLDQINTGRWHGHI
jgi:hypothetical protein